MVRVGLPVRMHSEVRSVCLPSHFETHPRRKEVQRIEQRITEINGGLATVRDNFRSKTSKTTTDRRLHRQRKEKLLNEKLDLMNVELIPF